MRHKCQKQKRAVTNKQRMAACLITDTKYILRTPGFQTVRRLGPQPNGVNPPWVKEREMPPRIDEWQMSHFHLWGWERSHWSAVMSLHDWKVFVCASSCEIDKGVKRKIRKGESLEMSCPSPPVTALFGFSSEECHPGPHYSSQHHPVLSPCLQHGRCLFCFFFRLHKSVW